MQIWHVNQDWPALEPCFLTLGSFDGLHRGHQELLGQLAKQANQKQLKAVALTFDPHPKELLRKQEAFEIIAPLDWLKDQWAQLGVDHVIVKKVDQDFLKTTAIEFLSDLMHHLSIKGFVVGYDVGFGAGREGNAEFLKAQAEQRNCYFQQVPALTLDGEIVSSRSARDLIRSRNFEKLQSVLNRKYFVQGEVVGGAQLGRKLGFPTANLSLPKNLCLPHGVFAGRCLVGNQWFWAVANVGYRPTVDQQRALHFEVHILDFDQSLYGQTLRFEFDHCLREEKKFSNLDELKEQIRLDVDNLRRWSSYKKRHSNII